MRARIVAFFLILLSLVASAHAKKHLHKESYYQAIWCREHNGRTEVVLADKTRCDCLTSTHAVEVEFANKWAESIGQALYYAIQTRKRAGIVLILERPQDYKYWIRLNTVIQQYNLPIDTWEIRPEK